MTKINVPKYTMLYIIEELLKLGIKFIIDGNTISVHNRSAARVKKIIAYELKLGKSQRAYGLEY